MGRPIDFADKYIEPRTQAGQAELDRERRKKGPAFQKATPGQVVRRVLLVLLGLVLLYAGYILMDAWMDLHAMPAAQTDTVDGNTISTVALEAKAAKVDSLSLDGAVMLDAMMDDLSSGGYTAACFDIKRADGTVGYASTLGTVAAAGAVSSPAGDLRSSCQKLGKNDLLVLGHIVCYPDNVQTAANPAWAVKSGKTAYTDPAGNRYLNPDSTLVRAGPAMRNARRNAPWYRLSAPNLMNCFGMSSRESGQSLVPDPPARTRQWMSFKSTTPVE